MTLYLEHGHMAPCSHCGGCLATWPSGARDRYWHVVIDSSGRLTGRARCQTNAPNEDLPITCDTCKNGAHATSACESSDCFCCGWKVRTMKRERGTA